MLDKKMLAVLAMLAEQVGYSYKVVKKQMLLSGLPNKYAIDMDTLVAIIAFLKEKDFVVVKYQDKEEICLALTVKAETYLTGEQNLTTKSQISNGQIWLLFLGVFVAALLGSLVAAFLVKFF